MPVSSLRRKNVLAVALALLACRSDARAALSSSVVALPAPSHRTATGGAPATVVETFPVTWHEAVLGLEDNGSGDLFVAHEGYSPDPATLWYVSDVPPHAAGPSLDLAALNPGFPVSLNDRDGVAWDSATSTYFLPDFQGDLQARDDNIVEIDAAGTILNAWELDGAGNDSSDASAINLVLDMAIVPGVPNRYFVTNLGSNTVFEIALTRAGLFSPASWSTVSSCDVTGLSDNSGIDYDSASGLFYHSDFGSGTVVVTDIACNLVDSFDCTSPDADTYAGLALVEGTSVPEVWLTDFNSQTVSRCRLGGAASALEVPALSRPALAALALTLAGLTLLALRRRARG